MSYQNGRVNSDRLEMLKQAVDFKGLSPDKFKIASEIIASIPNDKIDLVLKNALNSELVSKEEYEGAREFLVNRKNKLLKEVFEK